ncbi:hypothetical protein [Bergeriella denitrificans]|uniref:hypothetical protein n=2 Tax=Bergeriella denitrificans TaxID=494 RepID=UPI00146FCA42|nr:hypothetical protein [Bergeriella denitrificans]
MEVVLQMFLILFFSDGLWPSENILNAGLHCFSMTSGLLFYTEMKFQGMRFVDNFAGKKEKGRLKNRIFRRHGRNRQAGAGACLNFLGKRL